MNDCFRINGGYSKYTYKIVIDDKPFIFQILKNPHDVPGSIDNVGCKYLYPGGFDNYCKVKTILEELKISIPQTIFIDSSKINIKSDYALYEFIEIDSYHGFEEQKQKGTLENCLFEFGSSFGVLKEYKRSYPGDLLSCKNEFVPHEIVFNVACDYLKISSQIPFIRENRIAIKDKLEKLWEKIVPRDSFYLIHGDFKPDNFRFDKNGTIYWIDFECLHYFDMEYELSQFIIPEIIITNSDYFLNGYLNNRDIEIDETRLIFYKAARCLAQIVNCSNPLIIRNEKEPVDKIIMDNVGTLKALL